MFCPNCGTKVSEKHLFCTSCGTKLPTTHTPENSSSVPASSTPTAAASSVQEKTHEKPSAKSSKKSIFPTILLLCLVAVLCIVGMNYYQSYAEQKEKERKEQEARARENKIMRALRDYSFYPFGLNDQDFNTVEYSGALGSISDAALGEGPDNLSKDATEEEKKKYAFDMIARYIESDYSKTYAALIFGADYFSKEEISQFYNGTKLSSYELKEHAENLMCRDAISLSSLLINKEDQIICLNIGARLNFTQRGYMSSQELISELYDFVKNGSGIPTIDEDLLLENVTNEYIQENFDEFFSGKKVYYKDLSPVGQLVFLYVIPSYIARFDLNGANNLWSSYALSYEDRWDEIINRDIFSDILE